MGIKIFQGRYGRLDLGPSNLVEFVVAALG